jgi:hypothetical protein
MGELTTADVEQFTGGRMLGNDPEVLRMLDAALVTARRECGWHVSPVRYGDTMILDGPESRILSLPSRRVVDLTSVVEDGTALALTDLRWATGGPPGGMGRPAAVRKKSGGFWSGDYQAIEVTMDHGYTEEEAADWRQAILSMVDQIGSIVFAGRSEADLVSKKVDDVTYTWGAGGYSAMAQDSLTSVASILADYTLPRLEFL